MDHWSFFDVSPLTGNFSFLWLVKSVGRFFEVNQNKATALSLMTAREIKAGIVYLVYGMEDNGSTSTQHKIVNWDRG